MIERTIWCYWFLYIFTWIFFILFYFYITCVFFSVARSACLFIFFNVTNNNNKQASNDQNVRTTSCPGFSLIFLFIFIFYFVPYTHIPIPEPSCFGIIFNLPQIKTLFLLSLLFYLIKWPQLYYYQLTNIVC